mgnify:CR=1 FL=1
MLHLLHQDVKYILEGKVMDITKQRIIILIIVIIVAAILGRLAVRAVLNFLLGGTMFGGNIL